MRLAAKDAFVSAAERANAALDLLHQPESGAALMPPRGPAHRTVQADIGQGLVESGWFLHKHVSPLGAPLRVTAHAAGEHEVDAGRPQ
jgi:hypothetical protein